MLQQIWHYEIFLKVSVSSKSESTPVFKKEDKNLAKNYRTRSVLPTLSKVFENITQKQVIDRVDTFMSLYLCGYRKGFSTQYSLLSLLE